MSELTYYEQMELFVRDNLIGLALSFLLCIDINFCFEVNEFELLIFKLQSSTIQIKQNS